MKEKNVRIKKVVRWEGKMCCDPCYEKECELLEYCRSYCALYNCELVTSGSMDDLKYHRCKECLKATEEKG